MHELIDTHCHLTHRRFGNRPAAVIERARAAGVTTIICASGDIAEAERSMRLADEHEGVYFTAGVHPHEAKDAPADYIEALRPLLAQPKCVALGECGLDYHHDFSPRPDQQRVFAAQLALAKELAAKVVIHTREALADTLAILVESGLDGASVVFHSFTEAAPANVAAVLEVGATISFSGIVTFARSGALRAAAAAVPADRILVETDGPYLSPEPVREAKTNEPANVRYVAECLAEVRNVPLGEFAEQVVRNARAFFSLGG